MSLFADIKDTILQYNTYFNAGFDDAYQSENGVYQGEKILFPNDTLGDYFYIRPDNPVGISNDSAISSCYTAFALDASATLVAVVKSANSTMLVNNLMTSLAYTGATVESATFQHEEIIRQELGAMSQEDLTAALANYHRSTTIVSIAFTYNLPLPLTKINCLPNPCECTG